MDIKIKRNNSGFYELEYFSVEEQQERTVTAYSREAIEEAVTLCTEELPNFGKSLKDGTDLCLILSSLEAGTFLQYLIELDFMYYLMEIYQEGYGKEFDFRPSANAISMLCVIKDRTAQLWDEIHSVLCKHVTGNDAAYAGFITKRDFGYYKMSKDYRALYTSKFFYSTVLSDTRDS